MTGNIYLSSKHLSNTPGVRTILNPQLGNKVHTTNQQKHVNFGQEKRNNENDILHF